MQSQAFLIWFSFRSIRLIDTTRQFCRHLYTQMQEDCSALINQRIINNRSGDDAVLYPPSLLTTSRAPVHCPPQPHRILQALRRYVRAENKDRQHTIRHYQHVLAVDPEKAAQMKSQVSVWHECPRWYLCFTCEVQSSVKTIKYSVYNDVEQKSIKFLHLRSLNQQKFGSFLRINYHRFVQLIDY